MTDQPPFKVTPATLDVIEALLSGDEELYGLKIAKTTNRPSGSVIPILMRLEHHGWAVSRWERDEEDRRGPRRRFYKISAERLPAARALVAARRDAARREWHLKPGLAQSAVTRLGSTGA